MKSFFRWVALFSVVALCVACAEPKPRFFVQISDPQMGFITGSDDCQPELERMRRIAERVNELRPDMIVVSGDMVHQTTSAAAHAALEEAMSLFSEDIPIYYVAGNHDVGNASAEEIDSYIERYGYDRFVYRGKGYDVVGYNSCVIQPNHPLEAKEYEWLREQLSTLSKGNKPLIVVGHHPFFVEDFNEEAFYFNIEPTLRQKYVTLLEEYGVDLALSGHLHRCAQGTYNGITFTTAAPAGKELGKDKSGVEIITFSPEGKPIATYYPIEEIPLLIE